MPDTGWIQGPPNNGLVSNYGFYSASGGGIPYDLRSAYVPTQHVGTNKIWGDYAIAQLNNWDIISHIPVGANIVGIEIRSALSGGPYASTSANMWVRMSPDAGATWSSYPYFGTTGPTVVEHTFGGPADLWNLSWTRSSFSAPNFYVMIRGCTGATITYSDIDHLWIKVYYSEYTQLTGDIDGLSSLSGDLDLPTIETLAGQFDGVSQLEGELVAPLPIAGVISSYSNLIAAFGPDITDKLLSSNINAETDVFGKLKSKFSVEQKTDHIGEMLDHLLEQYK